MAFHYIATERSKSASLLLTVIICMCGSGVAAQTGPAIIPDVQELQNVSITDNTIVVQWIAPPTITEFKVSYSNGSTREERNLTNMNYTITNLLPGVNYNITVYSVNGTNTSSGVTIYVTTLPSIVKGVNISNISPNEVTISWARSTDTHEDTYTYTVDGHGPGFVQQTGLNNISTVVPNLDAGTHYNFFVYAVTNNDVYSSAPAVTNTTTLPSKVEGVNISNISPNEVTMSWARSNDTNENTYTYTVDGNGPGFVQQAGLKNISTVVPNLEAGTHYNFFVYAVTNNDVYSTASDVANTTTLPSVVKGLMISNISTNEVTVSWTKSNDTHESTYTYTVDGHGEGFVEQTNLKANSTVVPKLKAGSNYTFFVYAVTYNGVQSPASDVATATTKPSSVLYFAVSGVTENSINLTWTFPSDIHAQTYTYTVENLNTLERFTNLQENHTILLDLLPGLNYSFTIYAVTTNQVNSSAYPAIDTTTMPNEPQSLTTKMTSIDEICIVWKSPGDIHASLYDYNVKWQNVHLMEDHGLNTTKDTRFNIKNLFSGNLYAITVTSVFQSTFSVNAAQHVQTNPVSTENFTVLNTSSTTAALQWNIPSYSNSQVNGYRIIVLQDEKNVYNYTTKDTNIVIDSLKPGYIYGFSVESFASNTITPQKRSLNQMDSTWISYSTPKTTKAETVPDPVIDASCSKVDGYQIKVAFKCPYGNYSEIQVLVNDQINYNCSCSKSNVISGLQPAKGYMVKIITLGTDKHAVTDIFNCYTDSTGVIVGSVLGILIFLLFVGLIVFFVFKKRRSKSSSEDILITPKGKRFHTISKERFRQHYENNHANSDFGFAEEYQELSSVGTAQSKKAAELPENRAKNRFTNVLPYDHSRVKLTTINEIATADYINANFMPGYNSTKEFIASQGPLPNTTADFWKMIWEHHVNTIVMLTNCMENGRVKCERYWPLDYTPCTYGDITVTVTSETILREWTTIDFSVKHAKQPGALYVRHFHFTAWPDHGVPDSTSSILQFRNLVREHMDQQRSSGPAVVHCSAGVGRTGTLIALDYLIQKMEREHCIGIYGCVEKMRMNRGLMVQTEEQYIFLNKCMLDLIEQPSEENIYENQAPTDLIYENATVVRNFQRENA